MKCTRIAAMIAAAGVCGIAAAQDSVSTNAVGGAGIGSPANSDAPNPFDPMQTIDTYVIDMGSEPTSWGNVFGYAPLIKSHRLPNAPFYNNLTSGVTASQTVLRDVAYAAGAYSFWDFPGGGVHPQNNVEGQMFQPQGEANQFAVMSSNFGGSSFNGVQSAIVNYDTNNPARLFVKRVQTTISDDLSADGNQFGIGSITARGISFVRADDSGTAAFMRNIGFTSISAIDNCMRDPMSLNVFSTTPQYDAGASTDLLLAGNVPFQDSNLFTPAAVPGDLTGGLPWFFATDFNSNYNSGSTPGNSTQNAARPHLDNALVGGTRGATSFSDIVINPSDGSVGTGALLAKSFARGDDPTDTINLWGIDSAGQPTTLYTFTLPATLTDFVDAQSFTDGVGGITFEFDGYRSQTAFRGGNGQIAVGCRPDGRIVAAATVYMSATGGTDPFNAIAVVDFDPNDPSDAEWRLAGWTASVPVIRGKPIKDGPGGADIGAQIQLLAVTGGAPLGPSISAPHIDGMGNVWFIGSGVQDKEDMMGVPFEDFDSIVYRSVWNGSDGYELERVLELGDVIEGQNSGRRYQVQFFGTADADSISSSTMFSNSGIGQTWNQINKGQLQQDDTESTAGIVIQAEIVYDADDDGDFNDTTGGAYDPAADMGGQRDEAYNVSLFIGHGGFPDIQPQPTGCNPADLNDAGSPSPAFPNFGIPDGVLTPTDFSAFSFFFSTGDLRADINTATAPSPAFPGFGVPDGLLTPTDFSAFVAYFSAGCPCTLPGCP